MRIWNLAALVPLLCVAALAVGEPTSASGAAAVASPADSMPPLAKFFVGRWECRGGTPSGRVMNARVVFSSALDVRFVQSEHVDDPPGKYHSLGLWPAASGTAPIATVVYDNFGGARRFTAQPWGGDSVLWMRDSTEAGARAESFTYRRASDSTYWYAWHVGRTRAGPWVLGDSATCRRAAP